MVEVGKEYIYGFYNPEIFFRRKVRPIHADFCEDSHEYIGFTGLSRKRKAPFCLSVR